MPKVDYIFRGGLSKVYVCRQGGRGGQKSRKSDDVFYERPLIEFYKQPCFKFSDLPGLRGGLH